MGCKTCEEKAKARRIAKQVQSKKAADARKKNAKTYSEAVKKRGFK